MNSKNISEIILPVTYPIINSYTHYDNLFSILGNYKKTQGWIYNNMINLWGYKTEDGLPMIKFGPWHIRRSCPFIKTYNFDKHFIDKSFGNITNFIISSIQLGYYVYLFYDEYYIPLSDSYLKRHFEHHLFIYGFNIINKEFNVADYFTNSKYSFEKAFFKDVEYAINAAYKNPIVDGFCELIKPVDSNYIFELDTFLDSINHYLNSKKYLTRFDIASLSVLEAEHLLRKDSTSINFGLKNYNLLKLELLSMKQQDKIHRDIKPLHMIYNHMVLMTSALTFLYNNKLMKKEDCILSYKKNVLQVSLMIRNLYLKYIVSSNQDLIDKIIHLLDILQENEQVALENLLYEIK